MPYLAIDRDGEEGIYFSYPLRDPETDSWFPEGDPGGAGGFLLLPPGTIKQVLGVPLNWEDEPVEFGEGSYRTLEKIEQVVGEFLEKKGCGLPPSEKDFIFLMVEITAAWLRGKKKE